MRVEVVTVCVGYGDFLSLTLPENLPLVDDMVVITSDDDEETRQLCKRYSVHCVVSQDYKRGGPFNKARMIQRGFDQIGRDDWVLHMDADVILPRRFRDLIEWADLDIKWIYGADRCNVLAEDWLKYSETHYGWDNHAYENLLRFYPRSSVGSRWVSKLHGYVPIGFFQLHYGPETIYYGTHQKRYPYHPGSAARADVQFALQWDRRYRQVLPEAVVLHLESEQNPSLGANWLGRTTKRVAPPYQRTTRNGPSGT